MAAITTHRFGSTRVGVARFTNRAAMFAAGDLEHGIVFNAIGDAGCQHQATLASRCRIAQPSVEACAQHAWYEHHGFPPGWPMAQAAIAWQWQNRWVGWIAIVINVRRIWVVIQAAVTTVTIDGCVGKRAFGSTFVARHTFSGCVAASQWQTGEAVAFERGGIFPRRRAMAFFALLA